MNKYFDNDKLVDRWRELGHTDACIADITGIKPSSLSRKLRNGSDFSATQVILICEHIGEPMDMFIKVVK